MTHPQLRLITVLDSNVRIDAAPGSIAIGIGNLLREHGESFVDRLVERALACHAVMKVEFTSERGEVAIEYDRRARALSEMLTSLAHTLRAEPAKVTVGITRYAHLSAAGGCFFMSIVGLITPGIPTVPFVLATSYFLVRSSPELNERFRQSRVFGPITRDWQDRGGLRRGTKMSLLLCTFGLMSVTVLVADVPAPLLALMAIMGGLGLWLICRIPTLPDAHEDFWRAIS